MQRARRPGSWSSVTPRRPISPSLSHPDFSSLWYLFRSPCFTSSSLPTVPSPTTPRRPGAQTCLLSARYWLRHSLAGSPQRQAESSSSSYGPVFHLQLLPTPPHGDAVTFGYNVQVNIEEDFHLSDSMRSQAHAGAHGVRLRHGRTPADICDTPG